MRYADVEQTVYTDMVVVQNQEQLPPAAGASMGPAEAAVPEGITISPHAATPAPVPAPAATLKRAASASVYASIHGTVIVTGWALHLGFNITVNLYY